MALGWFDRTSTARASPQYILHVPLFLKLKRRRRGKRCVCEGSLFVSGGISSRSAALSSPTPLLVSLSVFFFFSFGSGVSFPPLFPPLLRQTFVFRVPELVRDELLLIRPDVIYDHRSDAQYPLLSLCYYYDAVVCSLAANSPSVPNLFH